MVTKETRVMMDDTSSILQPLRVSPSDNTPEVDFDSQRGELKITGVSMPENVIAFYTPALDWAYRYVENPAPTTRIQLRLSYFNTASSKMFLELLAIFEELHEKQHDVRVTWFYGEDDADTAEAGADFELLLRLPFEVVKE